MPKSNPWYKTKAGREIEEIWRKETTITGYCDDGYPLNSSGNIVSKPNQKQFKEFDDVLFKSYIDKFSDDGKLKAFRILYKEVLKYYSIDSQIEHNKALGLHE